MSRALELAQAYADAVSTHRLESLYGTSKSYTLEKSRERDEAHDALTAELRRLAQVEAEHAALLKAISDAEPVAEIRMSDGGLSGVNRVTTKGVQVSVHRADGDWTPLYTLNGIKKP